MSDLDRRNDATLARIERSLESPPERRMPHGTVSLYRAHCGETWGHEPAGMSCGRPEGHAGDCGSWVPLATEEVEVVAGVEEREGDAYPRAGRRRIGPAYPWALDDADQDEVIALAEERELGEYENAMERREEARRE